MNKWTQARLHRRRHRRRRRLPARRRRLHVRAGPSLAGLGRRGRARGSSRPGSRSTPDNIVTILIPHCEMGQGTQTALAMMAAEELEADWPLVRVQEAPALDAYANGYIVRAAGGHYVPAVARARRRLRRLQDRRVVRLSGDRRLDRGARHRRVRHARRRRRREGDAGRRRGRAVGRAAPPSAPREALAGHARGVGAERDASASSRDRPRRSAVPTSPALKDPDSFTIRRTSPPRLDIPSKVDGSAKYAHRLHHAGHALRGHRDGAGLRRHARRGRHRARPTRCRA